MLATEIEIPYTSRSDCFRFVVLGDLHGGNACVDERLVDFTVDHIAQDDKTYWFDLGDSCDFINLKDKRFDINQIAPWLHGRALADLPKAQIGWYKRKVKRIAHKCLARCKGNHETKLSQQYEREVYEELNEAIGLPEERALGVSGFVRLRFKRMGKSVWTHTFFLHHGAGGGGKSGAVALRLESLPMGWEADTYCMAHTHKKVILPHRRVVRLEEKTLKITERTMTMICVGAFMRGEVVGYAEQGMMYPQGLGPVDILIWPDSEEVRIQS